jgi:CRP-like cAMP-binding protein
MQKVLTQQTNQQQLILQEVAKLPLLSKTQKKVWIKKGEDAFNSLDTQNYFYFIMSGKMKIYQLDFATSKEQILYMLSRGDMFDVVALLDGSKREYISEVLEDVELIEMPIEEIESLILQDAQFRQFFYSYLASQLKSMEELAVSLSFYDVYQRVLQLFTRFTHMQDNKPTLKVIDNLKHDDIASMIGTVRKVLNRTQGKKEKK